MVKNFYYSSILLLFACFISCNSSLDFPEQELKNGRGSKESMVTPKQAKEIAELGAKLFIDDKELRKIDENGIYFIENKNHSVNNDGAYIINFVDENGFAIIAGNHISTPILGVSGKGHITDITLKEFEGVQDFIQTFLETDIEDYGISYGPVLSNHYDTITECIANVGPRVEVVWGQRYPAGLLCPNGLAGCTVIAAVQALSYFKCPEGITLSYLNENSSGPSLNVTQSLNWIGMINNIHSTNSYSDYQAHQSSYDQMLSKLCRELGYKSEATYNPSSTNVNLIKMRNTLDSIGSLRTYQLSQVINSSPNVENDLGTGVILMAGYDSTMTGHAFLIDGYKKYSITIKEYGPFGNYIRDVSNATEAYAHINWGWDGHGNGYFLNNVYCIDNYNFSLYHHYFKIYQYQY